MSNFIDEEAEVSEGDEEEYTHKEKQKLKKMKQIHSDDSSEEEEDGKFGFKGIFFIWSFFLTFDAIVLYSIS